MKAGRGSVPPLNVPLESHMVPSAVVPWLPVAEVRPELLMVLTAPRVKEPVSCEEKSAMETEAEVGRSSGRAAVDSLENA